MKGIARQLLAMLIAMAGVVAWPCSAAEAKGVAAFQGSGADARPCPEIERDSFTGVGGGCEVYARGDAVRLTVWTMFGRLDFARCDVQFTLAIGPRGETLMTGMVAFGIEPNSACGDVIACRRKLIDSLPWEGRLVATADGGFRNLADSCLDTCMGRFEGRLPLELVHARRGWRVRATRAIAGASGLQLDGNWAVEANDGLTLRRSSQ